jgi:HlyD family secretion protein
MKRRILAVAAVIAAGAAVYWFAGPHSRRPAEDALVLYGNVDIRQVDLGFRVSGRVAEMRLEEGDPATKGQILAVLDKAPFADQLASARAQAAQSAANMQKMQTGLRPAEIEQAKAFVAERKATLANADLVLTRQQELVKKNFASQQAVDSALAARNEAQARLNSAQKALDLALEGYRAEDIAAARAAFAATEAQQKVAETALSDADLLAPADGVILARVVEPGAIVAAGATVYTLSLKRPVWVRAYISEPNLGRIRPGLPAEVFSDSRPGRPASGQIGFISPVAEFTPKSVETAELRSDLVYRLRIIVENPENDLRQGMPVTVRIAPGARLP